MRFYFIKELRQYIKFLKCKRHNLISVPAKNYKNINFNIDGVNNKIIFEDNNISKSAKININIYGDNNEIIVKKGFYVSLNFNILIGQNHPNFGKVTNSKIYIDENTSMEKVNYFTYNSNSYFNVGKKCMFAFDINIFNTDAHPIYSIGPNEIINKVKGINIGNHCLIGANVTLLKNTNISDDCILGWGGVVSGSFQQPHCAIAGNPAKIVKTDITWNSNGSKGYVENKQ